MFLIHPQLVYHIILHYHHSATTPVEQIPLWNHQKSTNSRPKDYLLQFPIEDTGRYY